MSPSGSAPIGSPLARMLLISMMPGSMSCWPEVRYSLGRALAPGVPKYEVTRSSSSWSSDWPRNTTMTLPSQRS